MNILKSILTSLLATVSVSAWSAEQVEVCSGLCGETVFTNLYQVVPPASGQGRVTCQRLSAMPNGFKPAETQSLQCAAYAASMLESACKMYDNRIENVSCKAHIKS